MIVPKSVTFVASGSAFPLNRMCSAGAASFRNIKFVAIPSTAGVNASVQAYFQDKDGNKTQEFDILPGDVYECSEEITSMYLKSDTAGVVKWHQSLTDRFRNTNRDRVTVVFDSADLPIPVTPWGDTLAQNSSGTLSAGGGGPTATGPSVKPKRILVSLDITAPGPIFVGSQTLAVGVPIYPGETKEFHAPDSIPGPRSVNLFNPNAVTVTYYTRYEY